MWCDAHDDELLQVVNWCMAICTAAHPGQLALVNYNHCVSLNHSAWRRAAVCPAGAAVILTATMSAAVSAWVNVRWVWHASAVWVINYHMALCEGHVTVYHVRWSVAIWGSCSADRRPHLLHSTDDAFASCTAALIC